MIRGIQRGQAGMSSDSLERFVQAQEPVIERVLAELRAGRKTSHWMWYVVPQIRGLGHSPMAQHFAIASRAQAEDYLRHPVLGPRLRECTRLVNEVAGRSVEEIFGYPDYLKFCSSMTLRGARLACPPGRPAAARSLDRQTGLTDVAHRWPRPPVGAHPGFGCTL